MTDFLLLAAARLASCPLNHRIAILGSTGSIGCSALQVIEHLGKPYQAVALGAHRSLDKLLGQVRRHRPAAVVISDDTADPSILQQIRDLGAEIYRGADGMVQIVHRPDVDTVLAAVVGAAGLPPVLAAIGAGKRLALANKESLVIAGSLVIAQAKRRGVMILPVDSEHSAVFQAMQCGRGKEIQRVILTASGGPFRTATREQIENATLEDALRHPTWRMGNKITIDSATMFNKGLEIIEACWLFDLPPERIEVVVHPESIVHSMVEFVDGSVLAQLSPPDMRTPIQYAFTYPNRVTGSTPLLDLKKAFALRFEPPDFDRFPALRIAYDVARRGGTLGAVMNAANEAAVEAFCGGKISFGGISKAVELTIHAHRLQPEPTLDDLLGADRWARQHVTTLLAESQLRI